MKHILPRLRMKFKIARVIMKLKLMVARLFFFITSQMMKNKQLGIFFSLPVIARGHISRENCSLIENVLKSLYPQNVLAAENFQ
jgi:hypothetical protein